MLNMKFVLIITALFGVTFAQTIRCRYVNYGSVYGCELTINNPNGFNSFTAIEGAHLSGYNNARVGVLYRVSGVTTNVPRIICDTFPNLLSVDLHNTGMLNIDDTAFTGCTQVTQLDLWQNRINSISANALTSLRNVQFLNLEDNNLASIPSNLFANQGSLQMLYLSRNPFTDFPVGIFRPLQNLLHLGLGFSNLVELNTQWFGINNTKLVDLHVGGNRLTVTAQTFVGLESLVYLNIANNQINQIPAGTFTPLRNLRDLDIFGNTFTELAADSFAGLTSLAYLQIGFAPIRQIQVGAFRGLDNLKTLIISYCQLSELQSAAFADFRGLNYLDLSENEITDIGNFMVPLINLREANFKNNYVTTVRRSSFGTVTNLDALNFDGNLINAFDKSLLDAAVNFNSLYFTGNVCASRFFASFMLSRNEYLLDLQTCFANFGNLPSDMN